jgi:RimJ/RimL family protein N-acetyltransferase
MVNIWQGERVRLRAVEPEDWEAFYQWDQDTEMARLSYWIPFPGSREHAKKWTSEEARAEPKGHNFRWVIENLEGEFVGNIDTHACEPRGGTFEYGIAIQRQYWRRGYAIEAIRLVLAYFFGELRYQKVTVHVYDFNEPSLRLHRKLGMQEEGCLRRMIYTDGAYHDEIIFGMTAEEFKKKANGE